MRKIVPILLIIPTILLIVPAMITANVIGPYKDGTYQVDRWGAPIQVNKVRVPDELDAKLIGNSDTLRVKK